MSALFDFPSMLVVILLFICSMTFLRSLRPNIFNSGNPAGGGAQHTGFTGIAWKVSRIGERLSPYVGGCCIIAAFYVLFIK
jgi:hypothetical protein